MKTNVLILGLVMLLQGQAFSQTITSNASTLTNTGSGGTGISWTITGGSTLPGTLLNLTSSMSQTLEAGGFDFSALPAGAVINGIEVIVSRGGMVRDNRISLVKGGSILATNLASSATWPFFGGNASYGSATGLWGTTWTPADLNSSGFRVAIRTQSIGMGLIGTVSNVAVRVSFLVLAPITLSRFDVTKTGENHVKVSWKTELEDKVQTIFVERSNDGENFETIASLQPRGGRNQGASYEVTDRTPADGNNYYRLKELDTEGQYHYYQTKLIRMFSTGQSTAVYQNGNQLMVRSSGIKGEMMVRIFDTNGRQVDQQSFRLTGSSSATSLPAPARSGVYYVTLSNGTYTETSKVFIAR
jgi:hypothetical protein